MTSASDGILFIAKVSPRSHRDTVKGVVQLPHDRLGLAVRVSPPAANGAANEAVIELLARTFKVSRSCVEIKSGANGPMKVIRIKGDPIVLKMRLDDNPDLRSLTSGLKVSLAPASRINAKSGHNMRLKAAVRGLRLQRHTL